MGNADRHPLEKEELSYANIARPVSIIKLCYNKANRFFVLGLMYMHTVYVVSKTMPA